MSISVPSKIGFLFVGLLPVVVMAFYEGLLTSFMTITLPPPGIKSFHDVVDGGYKIVVVRGSFQAQQVRIAKVHAVLQVTPKRI